MTNPSDPATQALLSRAAQGDASAQAELLEKYRDRLRRMIAMRLDRRIASRVDASDVVQEALNNAHGRLPKYFENPQTSFYLWLRGIAWDRLVEIHRTHIGAQKRSVLKERSWSPNVTDESVSELAHSIAVSSINPGRRAMLAEMQARAQAALLELKPHDREILVLRYLEHLGVQEIAVVLGISQDAVAARHLRALKRLRTRLGDEFGAAQP